MGASPTANLRVDGLCGRFEAESVVRLRHPNVAQVYDRGECGGLPSYPIEYDSGGGLARRSDDTPWRARDAARPFQQVAGGSPGSGD